MARNSVLLSRYVSYFNHKGQNKPMLIIDCFRLAKMRTMNLTNPQLLYLTFFTFSDSRGHEPHREFITGSHVVTKKKTHSHLHSHLLWRVSNESRSPIVILEREKGSKENPSTQTLQSVIYELELDLKKKKKKSDSQLGICGAPWKAIDQKHHLVPSARNSIFQRLQPIIALSP